MNEKKQLQETIIIVDDEPINTIVVKSSLEKLGYNILTAQNGEEGLRLIREEHPDLVLLDVMMPTISGFEVCRQMKSNPDQKHIPVILLTALDSQEDVETGVRSGADEFISKPFNTHELILRIRSLLHMKHLTTTIHQNQFLVDRMERLTEELSSERNLEFEDIERLIFTVVDTNIRTGKEEKSKPESVFIHLEFGLWKGKGQLFLKENNKLIAKDVDISLDFEDLKHLGVINDNCILSNWSSVKETHSEYQKALPRQLKEIAGKIYNFLYYQNRTKKILLMNFGRELEPFDITWFRYIIRTAQAMVTILENLRQKELEQNALVQSLSKMTEIKDDAEGKHERIKKICALLCDELQCSESFTEQLLEAIGLYDIGKLLVDHSILTKQKPLSREEWDIIHKMPKVAFDVLKEIPNMIIVKEIISGLYEKWNGTGYPERRKGEEIPYSARIVSLANIYDSLRRKRSYRQAYSHQEAVEIITKGDGRLKPEHFDPKVLNAFIAKADEIQALYQWGPDDRLS